MGGVDSSGDVTLALGAVDTGCEADWDEEETLNRCFLDSPELLDLKLPFFPALLARLTPRYSNPHRARERAGEFGACVCRRGRQGTSQGQHRPSECETPLPSLARSFLEALLE